VYSKVELIKTESIDGETILIMINGV